MIAEDLPETIYHYTDIHGLQGIYEQGKLWATSSRYLNDTSEARLGLETLTTLLIERQSEILEKKIELYKSETDMLRTGEDPPDRAEEQSELGTQVARLKRLQEAVEHVSKYTDCYIASLSAAPDQLSQWRGYAKDGYCIGFSTDILRKSLGSDYEMREVVYYEKSSQDASSNRTLGLIDAVTTNLDSDVDVTQETADWIVRSIIREETAFIKDRNFREEKEIRIIPSGPRDPDIFTPNRYGMVPRVLIDIPDEAITKVIIGPGAHEELRLRSIFEYLYHTKFKKDTNSKTDPELARSIIPYRDW
ncbi:hypothetical protein AXA44_40540 [Rhodococcus sp. SC4]|nr:hypothetical protein AXA44_40540 [Rhodococcus sp. SC4]